MKKFRQQFSVRKMIGSVGKMKMKVKNLTKEYSPYISQCFSLSGPSEKGNRQAVVQRIPLTCPTLRSSFCPKDACSHFRVVTQEILFSPLFQRSCLLSRAKEQVSPFLDGKMGSCASSSMQVRSLILLGFLYYCAPLLPESARLTPKHSKEKCAWGTNMWCLKTNCSLVQMSVFSVRI